MFGQASARYPDIVFGKVRAEAEIALAQAFGISSIPIPMMVRDGVVFRAQPGALPSAALAELIEKTSAVDMDEVRASLAKSGPRSA